MATPQTFDFDVRPLSVKAAIRLIKEIHRRLPKVQGGLWAVSARTGEKVVGVALVGRPARMLEQRFVLAVSRVAVREGFPNVCSMLYGACSRAAKAMGANGLVTYTHADELGTSLRASNWIDDGLTDGGEWDRPSRPRLPGVDAEQKRRWWAPWSDPALLRTRKKSLRKKAA